LFCFLGSFCKTAIIKKCPVAALSNEKIPINEFFYLPGAQLGHLINVDIFFF